MDSILKNKIKVSKPARFEELITIECQLCLVELKDDKGRWSVTRSGCCSCAAICNEHKAKVDEVGWWRLWRFNLAISWLPLLVD